MTRPLNRFLRDRRKLDELSEWLVEQSFWSVQKVVEHLQLSRKVVDNLPQEVLPWHDARPDGQRRLKRYRPTDVFAYPAVSRKWARAIEEDREEEFLEERRQKLEERDRRLEALALGQPPERAEESNVEEAAA